MKQHNRYKLNNTQNYNHLGHPINAYHLIRHVVYGWEYIFHYLSALTEKRPLTPALSKYIEIIITYVYLYIHIFSYFTLCYIFALKIQSYSEFFLSYYSSTDNKKNKCWYRWCKWRCYWYRSVIFWIQVAPISKSYLNW